MKQMILALCKWIKKWFWTRPTSKPEPLKATEVIDHWTIIVYKGQKINLHKNELGFWHGLSRKDKRAMAQRFKIQEKKGLIRFEVINGKETCIRNKDYEN